MARAIPRHQHQPGPQRKKMHLFGGTTFRRQSEAHRRHRAARGWGYGGGTSAELTLDLTPPQQVAQRRGRGGRGPPLIWAQTRQASKQASTSSRTVAVPAGLTPISAMRKSHFKQPRCFLLSGFVSCMGSRGARRRRDNVTEPEPAPEPDRGQISAQRERATDGAGGDMVW
jgi:hypothetical protein